MSSLRCSPQHLQQISQVFQHACQQTQEMLRQLAAAGHSLQSEWHGPASQRFQNDFQQMQSQVYRSANQLEQLMGSLQQAASRMAEAEQRAAGGAGATYSGGAGATIFGGPILDTEGQPDVGPPESESASPEPAPQIHDGSAQPLHSTSPGDDLVSQEHSSAQSDHQEFHGPQLEIASVDGTESSAKVYDASGGAINGTTLIISGELVDMGGKDDQLAGYFDSGTQKSGHSQAFGSVDLMERIHPFVQGDGDNCGKTSAAMAINAITGSKLTDFDLPEGCSILSELNRHTQSSGITWNDVNLNSENWQKIEQAVGQGMPVVVGLNGEFSHTGRGHIVTIVGIEGDKVTFADPATGTLRETTRQRMLDAEQYPQGSFIMYPSA